ncbi:MAG: hypothetical protein Wins2KO_30270 [Winogradskyella sp.]
MKYFFTLTFIYIAFKFGSAQNQNSYSQLINKGWQLCLNKDYKASADVYEKAFKLKNDIPLSHRYNAACIHALAGHKDRAFHHLFFIGHTLKWSDYNHLINDSDLSTLHKDKRWEELTKLILKNKNEEEVHFDKDLVRILDQIYFDDQSTRNSIKSKEEKFGRDSKEMDALWKDILKRDSINLIKISHILDAQGWPPKDKIGKRGTSTLFLVIQHADQETQEKYLPLMTKAMNNGHLPKRQYAMFYDRLMLRRGKRQLYGTQLAISKDSKKPYVLPLDEPKTVDKRRIEMGLNTMQENLNRWNLIWDVEEYIKRLPQIEAKEKALNAKKHN